jgi:hypothetical protein
VDDVRREEYLVQGNAGNTMGIAGVIGAVVTGATGTVLLVTDF